MEVLYFYLYFSQLAIFFCLGNDPVERYRARWVVLGYAKKESIDFNEIFSPVVRLTTVRVVLAMCATFDLHLEQCSKVPHG